MSKKAGGTKIQQIFVNLPVKDLDQSMNFFEKIGFTFNPQFTNESAACMVMNEHIYSMLQLEDHFKTFTNKRIIDADKGTEAIFSLSVSSREEVDELVEKAFQAGGKPSTEPQDHGFMYQRGFQDLDGHLWEVFYMDMNAVN
ncbi:VOC family protein [Gracilibacillus xinjiangensis]|uniref:VOC family protein n=1 Tax=Gracilibacillus xinjiangensis TaxID=1193282 RepID=A0ABV8WRA8_9BACI